ncbi:hypothetical protein QE152_g8664 [Popillia japonica]|uniref:Reverse transcriptase n=1 Tax=Popillia japonica TaxID=7064 RepID=A0AAW1LXB2_POPJA
MLNGGHTAQRNSVCWSLENAFNSSPWRGILDEYKVTWKTCLSDIWSEHRPSCGVPQGSVLDQILKIPIFMGVQLIEYADDLGCCYLHNCKTCGIVGQDLPIQ